MKYPGYDYAFEIGQHVIINWPGDPDHGVEATVNNYGYYPDGILYELDIPDGYSGRWFWKQPKFRHRGMLKQFLKGVKVASLRDKEYYHG